MNRGRFCASQFLHRKGSQPKSAHDLVEMRHLGCSQNLFDLFQIANRLLAQHVVMLVGYRVQQGANGVLLVIDWEIGCGQDRRFVTALLEEVGEDQDQVRVSCALVATSTWSSSS